MDNKNVKTNVEKAVETNFDNVVSMDPATSVAYKEIIDAKDSYENLKDELKKKASSVEPESVKETKTAVKNVFTTSKPVLEEFDRPEADEDDKFLKFDMFEFIYSFLTDVDTETQAKIATELDTLDSYKNLLAAQKQKKKEKSDDNAYNDSTSLKKFRGGGFDNYNKDESSPEAVQVSASVNGDGITVYCQERERLSWVEEICDMYQLEYEGPFASPFSNMHWKFALTVKVPMTAEGYPMLVTDYFEDIGIPLEDVMPEKFVNAYNKRQAKEKNELMKFVNDRKVDRLYQDFVEKAANSNDPLEGFIDDMFNTMKRQGLKFSKTVLKKKFMDEFNDDFGDDNE